MGMSDSDIERQIVLLDRAGSLERVVDLALVHFFVPSERSRQNLRDVLEPVTTLPEDLVLWVGDLLMYFFANRSR